MLPRAFLTRPLAHRGLHDKAAGRVENSAAAVRAAVARGYGIEIDVQLTADGRAAVFHDEDLGRLTRARGPVRARRMAELERLQLTGGGESIPSLETVLEIVGGQAPLLVEIKDQDGAFGPAVGTLEAAVARALSGYAGPVAVMSFNPHSVAKMQDLAPSVPRGLTTAAFRRAHFPGSAARLRALAGIPDYARVGACFISHDRRALSMPRVAELKGEGAAVLCWTVRSLREEAAGRRIADNITFEGYLPDTGS